MDVRCDIMWLLAFALLGLLMCQYTFLGAVESSNSATATVLQSLNVIIIGRWRDEGIANA